MLRFTLKDLFLSITLIAIGIGVLLVMLTSALPWPWLDLGLWLVSGALIGAGGLVPFKMVRFGIGIGLMTQIILFFLLF